MDFLFGLSMLSPVDIDRFSRVERFGDVRIGQKFLLPDDLDNSRSAFDYQEIACIRQHRLGAWCAACAYV
jgi:hypothetical protein